MESLGATFLELTSVGSAAGEGGYARALTDEERQAQQDELTGHIARHDVVITTAQVPGRRPPLLVTEEAIKAMAAGLGGGGHGRPGRSAATWQGSVPGETRRHRQRGDRDRRRQPAVERWPTAASTAYARNISRAAAAPGAPTARLAIDPATRSRPGVVITHDGRWSTPPSPLLPTSDGDRP